MQIISLSDMPDPSDPGKTIKEKNLDIPHKIPLGTLVEFHTETVKENGVRIRTFGRMFVVEQVRDCDGTPLYNLDSTAVPIGKYGPSIPRSTELSIRIEVQFGFTAASLRAISGEELKTEPDWQALMKRYDEE